MKPVIITGDSHLGPIRRGLDLLPEGRRNRFVFWPLGKGAALRRKCHAFDAATLTLRTASRVWVDRVFSRETIGAMGSDTVLAVSLPLNTSRILRDYSWETYAPWHLAQAEFALSDQMVEAMIDGDSIHALNMVRDIAQIWTRTAVIEAPRFFANASYLSRKRLDVIRHVDAAYRDRVRAMLAKAGIDVIPQPAATITDKGMTALSFDHHDPQDDHHANEAYGKLVLEEIGAYVDRLH